MAVPRVFVSSTYYDLKQVRVDIEKFLKELGYEPILNEFGHIPYSSDKAPAESAYKEVDLCDILVSIIGGRYGSQVPESDYSVSQQELKVALEKGKQVFIFIEQSVLSEFETFKINRSVKDIKYNFVDDRRIFEFIEEVYSLPKNNPIAPFSSSADIIDYLRMQFAGLFQGYLRDQTLSNQYDLVKNLSASLKTGKELVDYLLAEKKGGTAAIDTILMSNHPIFVRIAGATETPYRVFFTSKEELFQWAKSIGWTKVKERVLDDKNHFELLNKSKKLYFKINNKIFDKDGKLLNFKSPDWNDKWISEPTSYIIEDDDDDDLPF